MNPREHWIGVPVPPIVSPKLWQKAQDRLQQNKEQSKRNRKNEYLLSHRVTCGDCGCKCSGRDGGRNRKLLYYHCNSYLNKAMLSRNCNLPHFRADVTDSIIWEWIESLLLTPEYLEKGLRDYEAEQQARQEPLRAHLEVVEGLLQEKETKLERLLDLYLAGQFPEDILLAHKNTLETTIRSLKKEQASLNDRLTINQLTQEEIRTIKEFARTVKRGLQLAPDNFAAKRKIIDLLDVQVTIVVENDEKVVYAKCLIDEATMTITSKTIGGLPAEPAPSLP